MFTHDICVCVLLLVLCVCVHLCSVSKYILQVTGKRSYLHGANELITFRDIRRYVGRGEGGREGERERERGGGGWAKKINYSLF